MEKFIKNLGNLFTAVALAALFYIYFPLLQPYFFPPKIQTQLPSLGYYLTIPKISAQSPIIENVNPWDESDYKIALKKGVASAKGYSIPPGRGLIYLFAHSSGSPWQITRYNTTFLRLPELILGDQIILTKDGHDFNYRVREKKEVWPSQTDFLNDTARPQLILQTCVPIGTSLKRLLIFADPV